MYAERGHAAHECCRQLSARVRAASPRPADAHQFNAPEQLWLIRLTRDASTRASRPSGDVG